MFFDAFHAMCAPLFACFAYCAIVAKYALKTCYFMPATRQRSYFNLFAHVFLFFVLSAFYFFAFYFFAFPFACFLVSFFSFLFFSFALLCLLAYLLTCLLAYSYLITTIIIIIYNILISFVCAYMRTHVHKDSVNKAQKKSGQKAAPVVILKIKSNIKTSPVLMPDVCRV